MALFKNGAPQFIALGADDQSGVRLSPEPDATPQHLPLFHIMAAKGTTERVVLNPGQFRTVFGEEAFDKNLGFYNHQTRFLEAVGAEANVCMIKRIIPEDAGAKANATVYLDILECPVPNYERNSEGDLVTDPVTNQYKINKSQPTVDGYKVKWVKEYSDTEADLGLKVSKTGTMKYIPDVSKLPDSYLKIHDVPEKLQATQEIKIPFVSNAAAIEVTTDKPEILTYNPTTETLQAVSAGKALVTIRTKDKKFKASMLQFEMEVTNTNPGEMVTLNVNHQDKYTATKDDKYITYDIGFQEGATVNINIPDFRKVHVEPDAKRLSVNCNCVAYAKFFASKEGMVTNITMFTIKGSGFTDEDVPSSYTEITSLVKRMKVGANQVINISQNFGEVQLHSDNEPVFMVDSANRRITARSVGNGVLTIKCVNKWGPADQNIEIKVEITVVNEDVPAPTSLNINPSRRILVKDNKSLKLELAAEEGATTKVKFSDETMIKFDQQTMSVSATGTKNGICIAEVTASKDEKEPVTSFHTIFINIEEDSSQNADAVFSTMYPIFELKAKNQGSWYNNIGFSVGSLQNSEIDGKIISELKALPYAWAFYTRTSPKVSPTVFRNLYSEPSNNIVFVEKATNPSTEARMDFEYILQNNWFNETDPLKALKYWDYEGFQFYRENFFEACKKFVVKEQPFVTKAETSWADEEKSNTISWFDFTTDDKEILTKEEFLLINPFSCKSSRQKMYFSLRLANESSTFTDKQSEVTMSADTPIFLSGGTDGTLSNEMYEKGVVKEMANYLDPDSTYHDLAINTESVLYDSGFTLDTKKELVNFITLRKDTAVVFTDHDASMGEKGNVLSDARAIAVAIGNRLKLAPESEYYGTPVCRAMVMVGTGKLRDGTTGDRIPLTYEIAIKAARMMGAANGVWDSSQLFDRENMVEQLTDVQPNFVPSGIKATLWDDGIVWPQPYNRSSFHFPALQTIYSDDTSVLNNYFAMMCLIQLTKLGDRMWRKFTGTATMSNGEFIDAVNVAAMDDLKGRFGGLFNVVVECIIDEQDEQRGYSWHLVTKLYGSTLKTVLVHNSVVYRTENTEG